MAEINVTPMVDVMLVLLIIFMVAAPLMVNMIPVDLPEAKSGVAVTGNAKQHAARERFAEALLVVPKYAEVHFQNGLSYLLEQRPAEAEARVSRRDTRGARSRRGLLPSRRA